MTSVLIAVLFSLMYLALYPVFQNHFVIYLYPPLPLTQTCFFIAGGIAVQILFCIARAKYSFRYSGLIQVLVGLLYLLRVAFLPGHIYQS